MSSGIPTIASANVSQPTHPLGFRWIKASIRVKLATPDPMPAPTNLNQERLLRRGHARTTESANGTEKKRASAVCWESSHSKLVGSGRQCDSGESQLSQANSALTAEIQKTNELVSTSARPMPIFLFQVTVLSPF